MRIGQEGRGVGSLKGAEFFRNVAKSPEIAPCFEPMPGRSSSIRIAAALLRAARRPAAHGPLRRQQGLSQSAFSRSASTPPRGNGEDHTGASHEQGTPSRVAFPSQHAGQDHCRTGADTERMKSAKTRWSLSARPLADCHIRGGGASPTIVAIFGIGRDSN